MASPDQKHGAETDAIEQWGDSTAENMGSPAAADDAAGDEQPGNNMEGADSPSEPQMVPSSWVTGLRPFFSGARHVLKLDELGREIAQIAVPAAAALAADPLASLVDTAFIGRIGSVQLAAVGVAISIFNQVSKIAIYPLVSVTTSFVAEELAVCKLQGCAGAEQPEDIEKATPAGGSSPGNGSAPSKRKYFPSVSSALAVGGVLGVLQTMLLIFAGKPFLNVMGIKDGSPMLNPARQYLTLRALGSPAVLFSLAMQGVFRGFKDTKTPLYATVAGDTVNIVLDPILIFVCRLGVSGAAIAHVMSQYLISIILLWRLKKRAEIVPPSIKDLKFGKFLKCGFLLLARVIAATFCVTLAASMAAHLGTIPMAAFQICLQIWLATSLLADGLAVAGQAILAEGFARQDHHRIVAATSRVLQLSVLLGWALSTLIGIGMKFGAGAFTKDINVMKLIHRAIPFVAGTQTINSIAFVFDGINFGASDYAYSAYSMVLVAIVSITCLFLLSASDGFIGIWIALTIYISLRMLAGVFRMGAAKGPWTFLRH